MATINPYAIGNPPAMTESGVYPTAPPPVIVGTPVSLSPYQVNDPLITVTPPGEPFSPGALLWAGLQKGTTTPAQYDQFATTTYGIIGYSLQRQQFWAWGTSPTSYVSGQEDQHQVTYQVGYTQTTMATLTAALQLTVAAEGFGGALSSEFSASLEMQSMSSQEWTSNYTETDTVTFTAPAGGATLLCWTLVDQFVLFRLYAPGGPAPVAISTVPIYSGITQYALFPATPLSVSGPGATAAAAMLKL
jgi:hypothetical protein